MEESPDRLATRFNVKLAGWYIAPTPYDPEPAMHTLIATALLGLATIAVAEPPQTFSPKLAKALEGRIAGKPVSCISLPRQRSSAIIDETAVIYKESRHRWYVNFPAGGKCPGLKPQNTIITRTPSTRLCSGDLAFVADLPFGFDYGACSLGEFVPYTK